MTATHTHTATFADGTTATRRSDTAYTHAARKDGRVTFHRSATAARSTRGVGAEVVSVDTAASTATACVVCGGDPRGVPSTSAVTGAVSWTPCWGNAHRA